jgi:formylglycine-generating enzyme required for sulfatase activity
MAIVAGSAWSILGTSVVDVPSMLLQSTATKISISTNTATAIFTPDSPTASPVSPQQAETTLPKIVFPNNPAIGDIAKRADGMNMLFVPASEFIMGSNYGGEYDYIDPAHKVYLDAYWIDQTEVTNKMYEMCVKDEKCSKPYIYGGDSNYRYAKYGNYPITNVNWNQATTYCEWAGAHLSTEAEWEKAARGTEGYLYPWGNDYDGNATNFCDVSCSSEWKSQNYNDGYAGTAPVGIFEKDKSPYGVYDLAGNVSEWVYDFFAEYQGDAYLRNPQGPNGSDWGKEERVVRGGSFYSDYKGLRVLLRSWQYPNPDADGTINGAIWLGVDYNQIGFRCAYSSP